MPRSNSSAAAATDRCPTQVDFRFRLEVLYRRMETTHDWIMDEHGWFADGPQGIEDKATHGELAQLAASMQGLTTELKVLERNLKRISARQLGNFEGQEREPSDEDNETEHDQICSSNCPSETTNDMAASQEQSECGICLHDLQDPESTPCGHVYCAACLREWLIDHDTCPECRSAVRAVDEGNGSAESEALPYEYRGDPENDYDDYMSSAHEAAERLGVPVSCIAGGRFNRG